MTNTTSATPRHIVIFDTTLRDGEQSPGASMNLAEKLELAHALVELGVDVIEAGFPIASPGDFEAVREIARSVPRLDHLRTGPLPRGRHRSGRRRPATCRAPAAARLSRHQPDPSRVQAEDGQGRSDPPRGGRREAGPRLLRRRRILARRRHAHRARLPLPSGRGHDRRRRDDGQHSRHGRLRHAASHGRRHPHAPQPRAEHRQGDHQRPLPQRPRAGRGQQPGRHRSRRGPGRMHDQRPGRTGRQLLARRDRHGPANPRRLLPRRHGHPHAATRSHQPAGGQHHRHPRAAQQGHRRPKRLRPRGRHPPGRHAQGANDLRDHASRGRRLLDQRSGDGQAQRPGRAGRSRQGDGLHALGRTTRHRLRAVQNPGR